MVQSTAEVLAERGTRYGQFINQAGIAQGFHSVFNFGMELSGKSRQSFHVDELEALNMIFNKLARITNGDPHYSDSWRDIAGYATLVADRLDNDTAKQKLIEAEQDERDARNVGQDSGCDEGCDCPRDKENVHHIDGDKTNNSPDNLELWSRSQPPGQRVKDKVKWAREILELYDRS